MNQATFPMAPALDCIVELVKALAECRVDLRQAKADIANLQARLAATEKARVAVESMLFERGKEISQLHAQLVSTGLVPIARG